MPRKTIGEGSEVVSVSMPRDLARMLRANGSVSQIVTDILTQNIEVIGEIPYSEVEEYRYALLLMNLKRHMRRAIDEAIDSTIRDLDTISWVELHERLIEERKAESGGGKEEKEKHKKVK